MSRIGIYGGTFNPPHRGHMQAARQAVELLNLDKLLLIPDRCPPHKDHAGGDPFGMGAPGAGASGGPGDWQGRRLLTWSFCGRAGATPADTMTLLRQAYPEDELFFLMGTDMLLAFPPVARARRKSAARPPWW